MLVGGPASAQFSSNPFETGASPGVAPPLSDLGDIANTGFNVTLAVGYKPMLTPLGIRAEAAYNQFGLQGVDGNVNVPAFTGNLVYELPSMGFRPYAIGGAGLYRTNIDITGGGSSGENHFGFNIGGGTHNPLATVIENLIASPDNNVTLNHGRRGVRPITCSLPLSQGYKKTPGESLAGCTR